MRAEAIVVMKAGWRETVKREVRTRTIRKIMLKEMTRTRRSRSGIRETELEKNKLPLQRAGGLINVAEENTG